MQKIIYLDQMYLSNIAKAREGLLRHSIQKSFWCSLFNLLKEAVLSDIIVLPKSEFHILESMYDKRVDASIQNTINELYLGLNFRRFTEIREAQIITAARQYNKMYIPLRAPWETAFTAYPYVSARSVIDYMKKDNAQIPEPFSWPEIEVILNRNAKIKYEKEESTLNLKLRANSKNKLGDTINTSIKFKDVLLYEKISLIKELFVPKITHENNWRVNHLWDQLSRVGISMSDVEIVKKFLKSSTLRQIPYIDICCSINAVIQFYYPERKCKGSDVYDVTLLASVLPYCDIVTTDGFMKDILVNRLNYDKKYDVTIFSSRSDDIEEFQQIIKEMMK